MRTWMLLVYKVPNEPTSGRVFVWRKVRKLGAILLHDSVWVLPATPRTREQLRWLANEITELNGEATVWESRLTLGIDEEKLIGQFTEAVDVEYSRILAGLKRKDRDLAALSRQYQQARAQDYFDSEMGRRVRDALAANGGKK
ncbi:MAG TPA: Chromate resistance protein ChrB [Tepidisphaeraceae bacterium]|nr:Chromate resistance protein ChrB [Tepidisphaeraceae bacterium]